MVDDNSTDGTFEKCRDYSNKVIIQRSKVEDFYTQEQWMQDQIWNMCRNVAKNGDWILAIDSDEFLELSFLAMKDNLLNNGAFHVYSFQFIHIWGRGKFRVDSYWGGKWTPRLFRFHNLPMKTQLLPGIHLSGIPNYVKSHRKIAISCGLMHYGYATDELRKFKSEKYQKYSKNGADIGCAISVLEKPTLVKLKDRLNIMKELQLGNILDSIKLQEFIKGMHMVAE